MNRDLPKPESERRSIRAGYRGPWETSPVRIGPFRLRASFLVSVLGPTKQTKRSRPNSPSTVVSPPTLPPIDPPPARGSSLGSVWRNGGSSGRGLIFSFRWFFFLGA
ncbi:hypothetical protein SEVIR_9G092933v4 [Setaria viridis]